MRYKRLLHPDSPDRRVLAAAPLVPAGAGAGAGGALADLDPLADLRVPAKFKLEGQPAPSRTIKELLTITIKALHVDVHAKCINGGHALKPINEIDLVLTHPLRWDPLARNTLIGAAVLAGFSKEKIHGVYEPLAGGIGALVSEPGEVPGGSTVAVLDIGSEWDRDGFTVGHGPPLIPVCICILHALLAHQLKLTTLPSISFSSCTPGPHHPPTVQPPPSTR